MSSIYITIKVEVKIIQNIFCFIENGSQLCAESKIYFADLNKNLLSGNAKKQSEFLKQFVTKPDSQKNKRFTVFSSKNIAEGLYLNRISKYDPNLKKKTELHVNCTLTPQN